MQPDEVKMISDKWHLSSSSSSSSHKTTPNNNNTGAVGAVMSWWNTPKKAATPIIMTPLDKTKNMNSNSDTSNGKKMADYDPYSPTNAYP